MVAANCQLFDLPMTVHELSELLQFVSRLGLDDPRSYRRRRLARWGMPTYRRARKARRVVGRVLGGHVDAAPHAALGITIVCAANAPPALTSA